jgi:hypothetical protein
MNVGNWDIVRVIPFLGIPKWNFCCSAEDNMGILLFYREQKNTFVLIFT